MKILLPLAWIYGGVMAFRNWMFDHGHLSETTFPLPIISIGNLTVGGTGKTPHTEYLLEFLTKEGRRCAMLSRGYGRKTKGFQEVQNSTPQQVGDEPWQVQHKFPKVRVCVCEKRVNGIHQILAHGTQPDVILLDDAYQHRYVKPGLSILLTDYSRPYFSDFVLPAGRLREFKNGSKRAHLIIVTKCPENLSEHKQKEFIRHLAPKHDQQIFFTYFSYGAPYPFDKKNIGKDLNIEESNLLLLCGIARPQNLTDHLRPQCKQLQIKAFPDHHNFTNEEIENLDSLSRHYDYIITTEKDAARLSSYKLPNNIRQRLWIQPIKVKFLNQASNKFNQIISNYVTENSRNSSVD